MKSPQVASGSCPPHFRVEFPGVRQGLAVVGIAAIAGVAGCEGAILVEGKISVGGRLGGRRIRVIAIRERVSSRSIHQSEPGAVWWQHTAKSRARLVRIKSRIKE